MLVIFGTVRLQAERLDEARPVMAAMITASRAEAGCLEYSYAEDILDRGLIRVSEIWESRSALEAHFATEHLKVWRSKWAALGIHDRNFTLYEGSNPQPT
jgi:quinol monooxygenase YgiN